MSVNLRQETWPDDFFSAFGGLGVAYECEAVDIDKITPLRFQQNHTVTVPVG
jgi:hypothetical protein